MSKVYLMEHPLVRHKVTMLRDKNTSTKDFRELAEEISLLMVKRRQKSYQAAVSALFPFSARGWVW